MSKENGILSKILSPSGLLATGELFLIVVLFLIAGGEPAPHVNEQHYLSRFKHYWNPQWCAGDLFLESPDAHFTIVLLAGWTTKFFSLSTVAWGGRLLAWTLLAYGWRRLSWSVIQVRGAAVLSAALWVIGCELGHFAGEWVIGGVEAKCFSYAFVLLALAAAIKDQWNWVWVHLGVATALHALVGGWSGLILLVIWAMDGRDRFSLRKMLPGLAIGGVLGLAGVLPPIAMNWNTPPEIVAEANQIYVFERLPHHLAPLSHPNEWVVKRITPHFRMLLIFAVMACPICWIERKWPLENNTGRGLILISRFALGSASLLLCGLAIEWLFSDNPARAASLLRYYWFRLSDIAVPMAAALIATSIGWRQTRQKGTLVPPLLVGAVLGIFLAVTYLDVNNHNIAPADRKMRDVDSWITACDWVAENTEPDALFLVPRAANSFKWRAGRAEVATWKDVPQDAASMVRWWHRYNDVFRHPDAPPDAPITRSLGHLGSERLKELAAKYEADYCLTTRRKPVSLPIAYKNRTYVVYDLRNTQLATE